MSTMLTITFLIGFILGAALVALLTIALALRALNGFLDDLDAGLDRVGADLDKLALK